MKANLKIYDTVRLIQETEVLPGMIIEAMPKSFATGDLPIPTIDIEPTGVFGYVIGSVVKEKYSLSYYKLGVPMLERILFDCELEKAKKKSMPRRFSEWTNKQGLCKLIGEIFGIKEQDENRLRRKHLDYFEKEAIVLSYENRENIVKSLLDFRNQRGKKEYVFIDTNGKKYRLDEMEFHLE